MQITARTLVALRFAHISLLPDKIMPRYLRRLALVALLAGAKGGIFSGGFRFIGDRLSTDFSLIGAASVNDGDGDDGLGCCLPTVNFI